MTYWHILPPSLEKRHSFYINCAYSAFSGILRKWTICGALMLYAINAACQEKLCVFVCKKFFLYSGWKDTLHKTFKMFIYKYHPLWKILICRIKTLEPSSEMSWSRWRQSCDALLSTSLLHSSALWRWI